MQAALLMNKLKAAGAAGMAGVDTSSLASGVMSMSSSEKKKASKASSSSHLAMGDKLNKNTVASLLAKSRQQQLTSDELEQAERAWNRPELTIEPLFRGMRPEQRYLLEYIISVPPWYDRKQMIFQFMLYFADQIDL